MAFHAFDLRYFLYYDFLPAGKFRVRQFMATNLFSDFRKREKDFEDGKRPPGKFSTYIGECRWDAKKGVWKPLPWKKEWSTPAAFKEPFKALALGDDFNFVTRSCSLFRATIPTKGTDRVLALVWDGRSRPIKVFITDAKTGKTFLFVPPAQVGGKPAFFEVSAEPKLEDYDPKRVPMPPLVLAESHRTIVHAARILVSEEDRGQIGRPPPGAAPGATKDIHKPGIQAIAAATPVPCVKYLIFAIEALAGHRLPSFPLAGPPRKARRGNLDFPGSPAVHSTRVGRTPWLRTASGTRRE